MASQKELAELFAKGTPVKDTGASQDELARLFEQGAPVEASVAPTVEPGFLEPGSKSAAFVQGIGQGATLGFGEEIAAGLSAIMPQKGKSRSFKQIAEDYRRIRDEERARNAAAAEQNPGSYLAGNVAGSVALPGMAAAKTVGLGAKIATGAKVGAATGAAAGLGTGEGGVADQLSSAAAGAAIGGTVGAAVPVAGAGVGKIKEAAGEFVKRLQPGVRSVKKDELQQMSAVINDMRRQYLEIARLPGQNSQTARELRELQSNIREAEKQFHFLKTQSPSQYREMKVGQYERDIGEVVNRRQGAATTGTEDILRELERDAGSQASQMTSGVGKRFAEGVTRGVAGQMSIIPGAGAVAGGLKGIVAGVAGPFANKGMMREAIRNQPGYVAPEPNAVVSGIKRSTNWIAGHSKTAADALSKGTPFGVVQYMLSQQSPSFREASMGKDEEEE